MIDIELDGEITDGNRCVVAAAVALMAPIEALRACQRAIQCLINCEKDTAFEQIFLLMEMSSVAIECAKGIRALSKKLDFDVGILDEITHDVSRDDVELGELRELFEACLAEKYEKQPKLEHIYIIRNKYSSHIDPNIVRSTVDIMRKTPDEYRVVASMEIPPTIGTTRYFWGRAFFSRAFGSPKSPQFDLDTFSDVFKTATTMDRLAASLLAGLAKRHELPFKLVASTES